MNKGLFCALCCVGVAGYASENEMPESSEGSFERSLRCAVIQSPDYKKVKEVHEIISNLEKGCRFAEQWQEKKKDWDKILASFSSLLARKLVLNLVDERSEEQEQELNDLEESITDLVQDGKQFLPSLTSLLTSFDYVTWWHYCSEAIKYSSFALPNEEEQEAAQKDPNAKDD